MLAGLEESDGWMRNGGDGSMINVTFFRARVGVFIVRLLESGRSNARDEKLYARCRGEGSNRMNIQKLVESK